MLQMPEFLKYPEWYIEDPKYSNEIGYNKERYKIKDNAPDFIKKSYEEYITILLMMVVVLKKMIIKSKYKNKP